MSAEPPKKTQSAEPSGGADKKPPSGELLETTGQAKDTTPVKPKQSNARSDRGRKQSKEKVEKKKKKLSKDSTTPKRKEPAESVLMDPRQRETRILLARACGLDKEREEFDKKFEEDLKKKAKEKHHSSDSTSNDNMDDDKDEKRAKKKKKKDDEVKETFHNEKKHQDSPNAKSPEASSTMLEEMDGELRVTELTHVKKLTPPHLGAILMVNFFRLPIFLITTKYYVTYGVSFILVCAAIMFAVGLPIVFLEFSMGQFTSLPPNTFFARICPIAQGVGFSMLIVRVFATACIHLDFRYLFLAFQHAALVSQKVDDRCALAGMPFCYTQKMCPPGMEMGMYGSCLKKPTADVPFKDSVLTEVLRLRALQSSPTQLLLDNELNEHNGYTFFSSLLVLLLAGAPLIDGAEMFATIAPYLGIAAFATPVVIMFNLEMIGRFDRFEAGWVGDMDAFTDPFAWIVAFCLMCNMFNLGEGTWMFIGSWLNFHHLKGIKTLLLTVTAQLVLMLLMAVSFTAWAVNVVEYQHNGFLSLEQIRAILRDRPLQFWITLPTKIVPDNYLSYMFIAYVLFTINSLGYVITTAEYLIVSLIRAFPFLVRVNKVQLRACVLLMFSGASMVLSPFLLDVHVFKKTAMHYVYTGMLMFVILYEMIIFVYFYGMQRVLVNFKVLFRNSMEAGIIYSKFTTSLKVIYRFIASWLLMLGIAEATSHFDVLNFSFLSNVYLTVVTLPFIVALWKICRYAETQFAVVTLFRSDSRFGPSAAADRKAAAAEENKMGGVGLH